MLFWHAGLTRLFLITISTAQLSCAGSDRSRLRHELDAELVAEWLPPGDTLASDAEQRWVVEMGPVQSQVGVDPPNEIMEFGLIRSGVLLTPTVALVTDISKSRLVAINLSDSSVQVVMPKGAGPGEMIEPTLFMQRSDSVAELWDNGLKRIAEIRVAADQGVVSPEMREFKGNPAAGCMQGSEPVVVDYDRRTERLFRAGRTGDGRWGLPLVHGTNGLNSSLADGQLLCDTARRQLLYAPGSLGSLLAYDSAGSLLWRRQIADFFPTGISEVNGMVRFAYAPAPANMATVPIAFVQVNDSIALLQMQVQVRTVVDGRAQVNWDAGLDSRLIDLRSGREVGRQDDLFRVLSVRGNTALVTSPEPEPWVGVQRFTVTAVGVAAPARVEPRQRNR